MVGATQGAGWTSERRAVNAPRFPRHVYGVGSEPDARFTLACTAAVTGGGSVLRFLHSWSWTTGEVTVPRAVTDLLSGGELAAGTRVRLGSWDVRVLVERP